MELVVDTNIMFSFFWEKSVTKKLLIDQDMHLFAPEFALEEIKKYEREIIRKTGLSKKEFDFARTELAISIKFIPLKDYQEFLKKALQVSPDENDIDFFALSLKLKIPIWSNDLELKKQSQISVVSTKEVIKDKLLEE